MAPSKKAKQAKTAPSPANTDTPSQSTTNATITATTTPEEAAFTTASDFATASELEPKSVHASEPVSEPVTVKPSRKRSKKDVSATTAPTSTTIPATSNLTIETEGKAALLKKTRPSGRKSASPTGKWGIRDTPPEKDSTDGESGPYSSESETSVKAAARLTPSPIRGWNHATPESMAAAQSSSSRGKGRNSRGKSMTPPASTATTDMMDTTSNQDTAAGGTTDSATATTGGHTNNGMNSPTPEFEPNATEAHPDSGSDYTLGSGQSQTSRPRSSCQQQVQIINNISNSFSHDGIGMVGMNHPPNTNPTAGAISPSLGPTLYSFPPYVESARFKDSSCRKRGPDGEELIYPRMGTFSPTLRPTSEISPSSASSAVASVPFLSLPSSNLSSQPAPKKLRSNTRINSTTTATTATAPTAATGAGQSSGRARFSASATPNGRGRDAASAGGSSNARQTVTARTTKITPKTARRYRTGLAGGMAAQGNGSTVATASSSNTVPTGLNGHGNGNGNAMNVDSSNTSGGSSTNSNVSNGRNNIVRYGSGLVRRVGNQPIIAHSSTPRPGITPAEIGASLSLELIRRREEARQLREQEEQHKEEERRRNIEEVRRSLTQQAQRRAPSDSPTGQQESSSSSIPTSPSTQHTLTSVQHTPPPCRNPAQYLRNQNLLGQSSASSGNPGQSSSFQLSQYHAPNHQPGNHAPHQQPLQHHHQSSYSWQHHQLSQQYQPPQYQQQPQHPQHPQPPQHPGSQSHHQLFNVQSSSYHNFTPSYSSSSNDYPNHNGYYFNDNHNNGNHSNYNQQRSNYSNQNYHFNNNSCNNYGSYNNSASFSASTSGTIFLPHPSQPYGSSRPWQGSWGHGPHPHPSSRRHIPFQLQLPDTLLANAHSHRYSTSASIRTSTITGVQMLTSPAPQPLAWPMVSWNPGSPTQHQFPEYDDMTRASQAEFATLPPIRTSAVQGRLQVQASSNHGSMPVPVTAPSSHLSSSSGDSGQQQQQQQVSTNDGQSVIHESDNDAEDEYISGSA